jgi:DNA-nicking Smr family endonuclease
MRRRVSEEEQELLARAMADVRPLKKQKKKDSQRRLRRGGAGGESLHESHRADNVAASGGPARPSGLAKTLPPSPPSAEPRGGKRKAPPSRARGGGDRLSAFASGDPKLEQKARRGRIEIERTLDLHGLTQDAARSRLLRFVETAYKDGCRCVLIVTGKGGPDRSPRGVIRARFLDWIEEAPLRAIIARASRAAPRHGGEGAFYLFLKRARS